MWMEGERVTRTQLLLPVVAATLAMVYAGVWIVRTARPITSAAPPGAVLDREGTDVRFGLPEAVRREIFNELATAEPNARASGIAGFPGLPWSQEDHRCAFERDTARSIAARRQISLSQVYLILDEGIRNKWLGPDKQALNPKTVPLLPRRK